MSIFDPVAYSIIIYKYVVLSINDIALYKLFWEGHSESNCEVDRRSGSSLGIEYRDYPGNDPPFTIHDSLSRILSSPWHWMSFAKNKAKAIVKWIEDIKKIAED